MSEENKEIDESLVAELVKKRVEEETKGILENKNKILAEKKELQERFEEMEKKASQLDKIDLSLYNDLVNKQKLGELQGKGASKELAELQLQFEQRQQDLESSHKLLEAKEKDYSNLQNNYHSLLKKQAILSEMAEHKFNPATNDILLSHLLSSADVRADGENVAIVMTKDGIQKTPKEFMSEFVQTDAAKSFLLANQNSGGGANGGTGSSAQGFEKMTETQLHQYAKDHPESVSEVTREVKRRINDG